MFFANATHQLIHPVTLTQHIAAHTHARRIRIRFTCICINMMTMRMLLCLLLFVIWVRRPHRPCSSCYQAATKTRSEKYAIKIIMKIIIKKRSDNKKLQSWQNQRRAFHWSSQTRLRNDHSRNTYAICRRDSERRKMCVPLQWWRTLWTKRAPKSESVYDEKRRCVCVIWWHRRWRTKNNNLKRESHKNENVQTKKNAPTL